MTAKDVRDVLGARVLVGEDHLEVEVRSACGSDMMSDVLAYGQGQSLLLTGLLNQQVIRTAEMLDTACVVFLRGKEPEASILELAEKCGVCVLTSPLEMYDACGILHQHGVTGAK